jgi:hypothetical protein
MKRYFAPARCRSAIAGEITESHARQEALARSPPTGAFCGAQPNLREIESAAATIAGAKLFARVMPNR